MIAGFDNHHILFVAPKLVIAPVHYAVGSIDSGNLMFAGKLLVLPKVVELASQGRNHNFYKTYRYEKPCYCNSNSNNSSVALFPPIIPNITNPNVQNRSVWKVYTRIM